MRKRLNHKGFSMSEVLIVVGILAVLAAVGFVALMTHMRNMKQLELDGQAKELFVAAQNHLSVAESQGYLGVAEFKKEDGVDKLTGNFGALDPTVENNSDIYYIIVNRRENVNPVGGAALLEQLLPRFSVDESARSGGSYIIRYQKSTAKVLDVFYVTTSGRYSYKEGGFTGEGDFREALGLRDYVTEEDGKTVQVSQKKQRREQYKSGHTILGWYGGAEAANLPVGEELTAPTVEIKNGETLEVVVTDFNRGKNGGANNLVLVFSYKDASNNSHELPITLLSAETNEFDANASSNITGRVTDAHSPDSTKAVFTIVVDSVTNAALHFGASYEDTDPAKGHDFMAQGFVPGEDFSVQAIAYNNSVITNIAESAPQTANSLFASRKDNTVEIAYFRHLLNLDANVSGFDYPAALTANQIRNLEWTSSTLGSSSRIIPLTGSAVEAGDYRPVDTDYRTETDLTSYYTLNYNGEYNNEELWIKGVSVTEGAGNAGLFGSFYGGSISNLELLNFKVTGSGNVGALIGESSNSAKTTITGVVVRNEKTNDGTALKMESTGGAAGGLVGKLGAGAEASSVSLSAAAVYVSATGSAGGLIGETGGTVSVTDSYSGGHTEKASYIKLDATGASTAVNVISSSGNAGGLIGKASSGLTVTYCYSTSSVAGSVSAGGLIGDAGADASASNCYAVGLVTPNPVSNSATTLSPFIACATGASSGVSTTGGNKYISNVVGGTGVTTLGNTTAVASGSDWVPQAQRMNAVPYDSILARDFKGFYAFPTIDQLHGQQKYIATVGENGETQYTQNESYTSRKEGFADVHVGDWELVGMSPLNYLLVNGNTLDLVVELEDKDTQTLSFAVAGASSGNARVFTLKLTKGTTAWSVTKATETAVENGVVLPNSRDVTTAFQSSSRFGWFEFNKDSYPGLGTYPSYKTFKGQRELTISDTEKATVYDVRITLDDITKSDGHFRQLMADKYKFGEKTVTVEDTPKTVDAYAQLIPGENITVYLMGGSVGWSDLEDIKDINDTTMAAEKDRSIADAARYHVPTDYHSCLSFDNSLFALNSSIETPITSATDLSGMAVAQIVNIRHLQNLDISVSFVNQAHEEDSSKPAVTSAVLMDDIAWSEDWNGTGTKVYAYNGATYTECPAGKLNGIYNPYLTSFNGNGKTISDLKVGSAVGNSGSGNAGLFRLVSAGSLTISNLHLASPEISGTNSSGAVVGVISGGSVTLDTVLAEGKSGSVSGGVNAGGLVGLSSAELLITNSAASLFVTAGTESSTAETAAGGLLGQQESGKVYIHSSYVGGHTGYTKTVTLANGTSTTEDHGGEYYVGSAAFFKEDNVQVVYNGNPVRWNIISYKGASGGLIGAAESGTVGIEKTFNTASVYSGVGSMAGGIIGKALATFEAIPTGKVSGASTSILDLVYTVAPVRDVAQWKYDSANLSVLPVDNDTSLTNGGVFATLGSDSGLYKLTNSPRVFYLADIYEGAKFQYDIYGEKEKSTIKYFGTISDSGETPTKYSDYSPSYLATYYESKNSAAAINYIIGASTNGQLQGRTNVFDPALDSTLAETTAGAEDEDDVKFEYPFSIWTQFSFDGANKYHFYGDWQPVKTEESVTFKFYFLLEDPANKSGSSVPIVPFEGSNAKYQMGIQLTPFDETKAVVTIPTVPYLPGYGYGNILPVGDDLTGYYVWTVYYGNLTDEENGIPARGETPFSSQKVADPLLDYTQPGGNLQLTLGMLKEADEITSYADSFTFVAHYYKIPNQFTLNLMDYDPSANAANYRSYTGLQLLDASKKLGESLTGGKIYVPRRTRAGYRFLGWYTQPDTIDSDGVTTPHGNAVFTFNDNGVAKCEAAYNIEPTADMVLYAHYEKIETVSIKINFVMRDADDTENPEKPLDTTYQVSFEVGKGFSQNIPLPGSSSGVSGYKVTKKVGDTVTEITLGTSESDEAYFVPKSDDATKHEYIHLNTGVKSKTEYPTEYTVYVDGTAAKEGYVVVHCKEHTNDDGSYNGEEGQFYVDDIQHFASMYPYVSRDDLKSSETDASYTNYHISNITAESIPQADWSKYVGTLSQVTIGTGANAKVYPLSKVFVVTYSRDTYELEYKSVGDGAAVFVSDYVEVGAPLGTGATDPKPTWSGHVFDGWKAQEKGENGSLTELAEVPTTMPAHDLVLTAKWKDGDVKYTVVFWYENADNDNDAYMSSLVIDPEDTAAYASIPDSFKMPAKTNGNPTKVNPSLFQDYDFDRKDAHHDDHFTFDSSRDVEVELDAKGTSVVNVYFKRNTFTLTFTEPYNYTQNNSGTYGLVGADEHGNDKGEPIYGYFPIVPGVKYTIGSGGEEYTGQLYLPATGDSTPQYGVVEGKVQELTRTMTSCSWKQKYNYTKVYNRNENANSGQYGLLENGEFKPITYNNWSSYYTIVDNVCYLVPSNGPCYEQGTNNNCNRGIVDGQIVVLTQFYDGSWYYNSNGWQRYTGTRYRERGSASASYSYFVDGQMRPITKTSNNRYCYVWNCDGEYYSYCIGNADLSTINSRGGGEHYTISNNGASVNPAEVFYLNGSTFVSVTEDFDEGTQYYISQTFDGKTGYVELDLDATYSWSPNVDRFIKVQRPVTAEHVYGFDETTKQMVELTQTPVNTCAGQEYHGKKYTRNGHSSNHYYTQSDFKLFRRITMKYQAKVYDYIPVNPDTNKAYRWFDENKAVFDEPIVTMDRMPDANINFTTKRTTIYYYQYNSNDNNKGEPNKNGMIQYYLETIPGETYPADKLLTWNGKQYVLMKEVSHGFNVLTFKEEFHDILGFSKTATNADPEFHPGGWPSNSSVKDWYDVTSGMNKFFYTRNNYHLEVYYVVQMPEKNEVSLQTTIDVPFERPLDYYKAAPAAGEGPGGAYKWGGWYDSPDPKDLTEHYEFDENMPAENKRVYGRWYLDPIEITFDEESFDRPENTPDSAYELSVDFYGKLSDKMWDENGELKAPYKPTKDGYKFAYWYYMKVNADGTTTKKRLTPSEILSQPKVELKAEWTLSMGETDATVTVRCVDIDTGADIPGYGRVYTAHQFGSATGQIKVGDVFEWRAEAIPGYTREAPTTVVYVDAPEKEIEIRYRSTSWTYTVNYYVQYSSVTPAAWAVEAFRGTFDTTTVYTSPDPVYSVEVPASSLFEFFGYERPVNMESVPVSTGGEGAESGGTGGEGTGGEGAESDGTGSEGTGGEEAESGGTGGEGTGGEEAETVEINTLAWMEHYRFDHYVIDGRTITDNYVSIYPGTDHTATINVYLVPDTDAIPIDDIVVFYDGTSQTDYKADMSKILVCPEGSGAEAELTYFYYCLDTNEESATYNEYVLASDDDVVNAGTYGVRSYLTVKAGSSTYLIWQSDGGIDKDIIGGNEDPVITPPLHLYVRRRVVILKSEGETKYFTKAQIESGVKLVHRDVNNDISIYTSINLPGFEGYDVGFVGTESASYVFSASSFRTIAGTTPNVFTYETNSGTNADNYNFFLFYGNLTIMEGTEPSE